MKKVFLAIFLLACLAGCKKHNGDQNTAQVHVFKGITVTDDIGITMGTWGNEDGDWKTDSTWTSAEFNLLNFPDTISLEGTYVKDTIGWDSVRGIHERPCNLVVVFPNPVADYLALLYKGLGLLKFKAVIVDKYYNRLLTFCCKDSSAYFHPDFSDTTKFLNGTIYRMYYSLSAKDSLNFYKGHGDILICREHALQDCQKYVP